MSGLSPRIFRFQVIALGVIVLGIVAVGFAALGSTESRWAAVDANKHFDERVSIDENLGVFLVKNGSRTLALANRGPYDDEPVLYCPSSQLFETERSGSKFDIHGHFFYGPAPRGMSRYPVRVRGDEVQIDPGALMPGPSRGAKHPFIPPAGRYCVPI